MSDMHDSLLVAKGCACVHGIQPYASHINRVNTKLPYHDSEVA